ncbi:hypothetical protein, partial [Vibrio paracholerae]|uniref:hypothetical protein n=1 Tax=Vibrio paracholerae TaxID=650003 RepID=UPI001E5A8CE4
VNIDTNVHYCLHAHNARLRGWQRIPLNSNTTTATTAAQWDWKRRALTVPLEAFVILLLPNDLLA